MHRQLLFLYMLKERGENVAETIAFLSDLCYNMNVKNVQKPSAKTIEEMKAFVLCVEVFQ